MIRISRIARDENNKLIRPNNTWKQKAVLATKKAKLEKKNHVADRRIYGDPEVRKALEKLFQDKCAYCETRSSPGFDWEVEHYRPKGEVAEKTNHPGYYWLAYEWNNLFPSCSHCNQIRYGKPRWGKNVNTKGGKSTHFPLINENRRAMSHFDEIKKEEPLLLNPCKDFPEKHFFYGLTGQIHSIKQSKKGLKTIELCHLKRSALREDRERTLNRLIRFLEYRNTVKKINIEAAKELDVLIKDTYLDDGCIYAGIARYVYKYPWKFGIE